MNFTFPDDVSDEVWKNSFRKTHTPLGIFSVKILFTNLATKSTGKSSDEATTSGLKTLLLLPYLFISIIRTFY
jgi:hypothetical protein